MDVKSLTLRNVEIPNSWDWYSNFYDENGALQTKDLLVVIGYVVDEEEVSENMLVHLQFTKTPDEVVAAFNDTFADTEASDYFGFEASLDVHYTNRILFTLTHAEGETSPGTFLFDFHASPLPSKMLGFTSMNAQMEISEADDETVYMIGLADINLKWLFDRIYCKLKNVETSSSLSVNIDTADNVLASFPVQRNSQRTFYSPPVQHTIYIDQGNTYAQFYVWFLGNINGKLLVVPFELQHWSISLLYETGESKRYIRWRQTIF